MPRVFICGEIENVGIDLLRRKRFEVVKNESGNILSHSHLIEIFSKYDAVITFLNNKIDDEVIKAASPDFKVISNYAVGFDNIDVLSAKRHGIAVCNTPSVSADSVAEHTFMLILACAKSVIEADRYVRQGRHNEWDPKIFLSHALWGQTLGIIGLGEIGTFVGQIGNSGFKMKILYHDIKASEDFELITGAEKVSLERLLEESDIISIHAPLSEKTRHMISREQLEMMKETAILVNAGRGALIDQEALIWALKEKRIKGAGLDVFEEEHNIPHELTVLGNVVLTPHMASSTFEARARMSEVAAQNVIDVFEEKIPEGIVTVE